MHIFNSLPLLTDFPTREHWVAAVWEIITDRLAHITTGEAMRQSLQLLLGPTHRRGMLYRAIAASRLDSGIGTREISRELWLTRQTISAVKKSLMTRSYQSARAPAASRSRKQSKSGR